MLSTTTPLTPCRYLFDRDPKALFPNQDDAFVNGSLATMMKIVDHLVINNPEALFLFDPTAFNNQCHLYALFTAQALKEGAAAVDRRFLYHSFFLSYAFLTDPKLLEKLSCKTLAAMKEAAPSQEFKRFLKDPESSRMHASRAALNVLFTEHMRKLFVSEENSLYPELNAIAQEDLQLTASNGKGTFYTFPKFAGVAYLVDAIVKEKIPLLFKVKVVTKEGVGSFAYSDQDIRSLAGKMPVIVFEMISTDDSLSYLECHDIAKKCPSYSQRNVSSKDRHNPADPCLFCSPKKIDEAPFQKKFEPVLKRTRDLLLALGADFVLQSQSSFLPLFSDKGKFPKLTELFEASVSMTRPSNLSVSHVYTDCAERASKEPLVADSAYETHLKERGLL